MVFPAPSHELIADSIETVVSAHIYLMVCVLLLTNCEKITPEMLDIPAILLGSGSTLAGVVNGKRMQSVLTWSWGGLQTRYCIC
nr:dihydroxy-acid dehydratase [Gelria sp. Kuro-4]